MRVWTRMWKCWYSQCTLWSSFKNLLRMLGKDRSVAALCGWTAVGEDIVGPSIRGPFCFWVGDVDEAGPACRASNLPSCILGICNKHLLLYRELINSRCKDTVHIQCTQQVTWCSLTLGLFWEMLSRDLLISSLFTVKWDTESQRHWYPREILLTLVYTRICSTNKNMHI